MGVKYRLDYKNYFDESCRVDISKEDYFGDPILVRGTEGMACIISTDVSDDPYEPICNSKATITVQQQGQIDLLELQQSADKDFTLDFYIASVLKFKGFIISDGTQQMFQSPPFDFTITATDGLMLLDTTDYTHADLTGGRCILNYFRQILFAKANLGLPLPIKWVNRLRNEAFPLELDILSGSGRWANAGEGFTDYNGNTKKCLYILEGLLRSMQSRIFQSDGYWKIERINDIVSGLYNYRETPAVLTGFEVSEPKSANVIKRLSATSAGNYSFIEEDAILRVAKGLKSVETTYDQDQRNNILPNGNMDIVVAGKPLYWGLDNITGASVTSTPSLSQAKGNSATINNVSSGVLKQFELQEISLPIDSDVLYTYLNFGFKFKIEIGATVVDGLIDWESTPFTFRLLYFNGSVFYSLNEFGYWEEGITEVQVSVPQLKLNDIASVDFNARQDIILPLPAVSPIGRTEGPYVTVIFQVPPGRIVTYDDVYLNTDSNSDVWKAELPSSKNTGTEAYTLNISTSHNGFYVSNIMTSYANSGLEKFYSDSQKTGATLTEMTSHAIMRNRYLPSIIFDGSIYGKGWSFGDIYQIDTLPGKNFMPLRTNWNTETCTVNISTIEVRDDAVSLTTSHYGKNDNDKNLSN